MKEQELRKHTICTVCGNKVTSTGIPLFWTASIQRHGIKMDAVKRQAGLEMMLNGNVEIAQIMGPNEEMTEVVTDVKVTLCEYCADPLLRLVEKVNKEN